MSEEKDPLTAIDFTCVICQDQCASAPADGGWAFCEHCCPDHQYEYDPMDRRSYCVECGQERIWEPDEDDCPMLRIERQPGEPIGTPISQISGRPGHPGYEEFKRIAASWGYE